MEIGLAQLQSVVVGRQAREEARVQSQRVRATYDQQTAQRAQDAERKAAERQIETQVARDARALQNSREDIRRQNDEQRRQNLIARDVNDRRIDDRVARRDEEIAASYDNNRQVFNEVPPPPAAPAPAGAIEPRVQLPDDRREEQLALLRARDRRVAERNAQQAALERQQIRDLARSERRIGTLTQAAPDAPRGAVLDVQA